jgi:type IV secretion system protein VirB10
MMDDQFEETLPDDEPLPEDFDFDAMDHEEISEISMTPIPADEPVDYETGEPFPESYDDQNVDGIEDAFGNEEIGEPGTESPSDEPYPEDSGADPVSGHEDSGDLNDREGGPPEDEPETATTVQTQSPVEPFVPEKSSAASVLGSGRPHKLNNQLILSIVVGTFALIFVFATFVVPLFNRKKAERPAKPKTTVVNPSDYSTLVPRKNTNGNIEEEEEEEEDVDKIIEELPPVNPQYQYREPAVPPAGSGAPAASERPDTRDDRLQAKTISGIKGITPSQKNYLSGPEAVPYQQVPIASDPNNPYAQFGMPAKDDYTREMLSMYQGANAGSYARQNDQSGKMQFYHQGRENAGNGAWLGYHTVWQGTIFEATLTSNINTDLPGEVTAWVTKNIYSSLDGRYLLIPQNSRLFGTYNSSISYSQSRVQVGWHTLIRPDGYMINLGTMQATDPQGAAGLKGFINDHPFQYLKALALLSAFNILNVEFNANAANTQNQYVQNIMANSQEIANTLGSKLIDRALDVQPTITIKAGTKINIVVNTNLTLPPLPPYDVTIPYHKGE